MSFPFSRKVIILLLLVVAPLIGLGAGLSYWNRINTTVTLSAISPALNEISVDVSPVLIVEFDALVLLDEGSLVVSPDEVEWEIKTQDKMITIIPKESLQPATTYSVRIDYLNQYKRKRNTVAWNFTTRSRPTLVRSTPVSGEKNTLLSDRIQLFYDHTLPAGALQITISPDVPIVVNYQDTVVVIQPSGLFSPDTIYTVAVAPAIGIPLVHQVEPYEFTFQTTTSVEEIREAEAAIVEEQEFQIQQAAAEEQAQGDILFMQETQAAINASPRLKLLNLLPYKDPQQGFSVIFDLTSDTFTVIYDSPEAQKAAEYWFQEVSPYQPTAEEVFWYDTVLPPHAFGN